MSYPCSVLCDVRLYLVPCKLRLGVLPTQASRGLVASASLSICRKGTGWGRISTYFHIKEQDGEGSQHISTCFISRVILFQLGSACFSFKVMGSNLVQRRHMVAQRSCCASMIWTFSLMSSRPSKRPESDETTDR